MAFHGELIEESLRIVAHWPLYSAIFWVGYESRGSKNKSPIEAIWFLFHFTFLQN